MFSMTTTELAIPEPTTLPPVSDWNGEEPIQETDLLTTEDARALTDRIRTGTDVIRYLIVEAYQRRAFLALGYEDWDSYLDGEFDGAPLALPREKRKEAVASLRSQGLSLRAIAAVTGTSPQTVANDAAAAEGDSDTEPVSGVQKLDSDQQARLDELQTKEGGDDFLTDEEHAELQELRELSAVDAELVETAPPPADIKGKDGKTYAKKKAPAADKKPAAPKVTPSVRAAKKVAALLDKARIAYDEMTDSDEYTSSDKAEKSDVDKALAFSIVDFFDSIGVAAPVRWKKLAQ